MVVQDSPKLTWDKGRATAKTVFISLGQCACNAISLWSSPGLSDLRTSTLSNSVGQGPPLAPPSSVLPALGRSPGLHPFLGLSQASVGGWCYLSVCLPPPQPPVPSRQWLEDALRENEPGACFVFLVGTKKDLLVSRGGPQENGGASSPSLGEGGGH